MAAIPPPAKRSTGSLAVGIFKLLVGMVTIATPVIGVWIASSLAAASNFPRIWVVVCGLVLFPLGPLAWDAFGTWRRRSSYRPRILTFADRITLRTLFMNVVFLAGLLWTVPQRAFVALATRGDWMLDGRHDATSEWLRPKLLQAAGGLEWVYRAAHENPYEDKNEQSREQPKPSEKPPPEDDVRTPKKPEEKKADVSSTEPKTVRRWPFPATLHPVVAQMPASAETSIEAVGRYVAAREPDPVLRVKALHDWVADRIAYDYPAYEGFQRGARIPETDADPSSVFRNRLGVCAGYSKLMVELGKITGDEIVYVTGDTRDQQSGLMGNPHAWNAAKIDGHWYLLDATWSRPTNSGDPAEKIYDPEYLFAPPEIFGMDHFPDDAAWQLREAPLSRVAFLRQPMMKPSFAALGLTLRSPTSPQITVANANGVDVEVANPLGADVLLSVASRSGGVSNPCSRTGTDALRFRCELGAPGVYDAQFFAKPLGDPASMYPYAGHIEVIRSP